MDDFICTLYFICKLIMLWNIEPCIFDYLSTVGSCSQEQIIRFIHFLLQYFLQVLCWYRFFSWVCNLLLLTSKSVLYPKKYTSFLTDWNDFCGLQTNTEGLYSCLICCQLHWKMQNVSALWTFFAGPIVFERYHFYPGCDYVNTWFL